MSDAHVKKSKTASAGKLDELESLVQPAWHVAALTILTSFAYSFYWFYKTWRDLSFYAGQRKYASASAESLESKPIEKFANISPMLRTIGLFIPLWHIYLVLTTFKDIAELHPDANSFPRRKPLLAACCVLTAIIICISLAALPGAYYLLCLLAGLPLAYVQTWINAYWKSVEPKDLHVRYAFTVKELVVIVLGSALLGLNAAAFFIGIKL
jgi:hypothetical protein